MRKHRTIFYQFGMKFLRYASCSHRKRPRRTAPLGAPQAGFSMAYRSGSAMADEQGTSTTSRIGGRWLNIRPSSPETSSDRAYDRQKDTSHAKTHRACYEERQQSTRYL